MRAGRSLRSGHRWAARPQPSWSGGWMCTPATGRCVPRERWGPACGARRKPRGLVTPKPRRPGRRQHRPHHRAGAAVAARLPPPRRPLPRHHPSKLRPWPWPLRPQGPSKRPAPPGDGAGAARGQALRQVATVSRPASRGEFPLFNERGVGWCQRYAGGSRASMYSITRRVSCDGVEAPLVTPTFLAPFSQAMSRSSSRSTR